MGVFEDFMSVADYLLDLFEGLAEFLFVRVYISLKLTNMPQLTLYLNI